MTRTGTISGTPQFMSPEQARGESLDLRTDLFSLGCVMYAACTGRSPFSGDSLMGVIHDVCEKEPKSIREYNPEIAPWLAEFVKTLLSKNPAKRFQTAEEVDQILTNELAFLQMPGSEKPKRHWVREPKTKGWLRSPFVWLSTVCAILIASFSIYIFIGGGINGTLKNKWGFVPTKQESRIFEAQAVHELAYQTHLRELALRGDMQESIIAHQKSLELGYDPPQSSYLLACAYSVERDDEKVFLWLEKAYTAGFHDYQAAITQPELQRLMQNPRFVAILNQIKLSKEKRDKAEATYFKQTDYKSAERLYRALLKDCPHDEHAILMIGASLLEQGKFDEAEPWNEKARHSVRFANFGTYNHACVAAHRGDFDLAFRYLNYSFDLGFTDDEHLKKDHHLISLRDDERFSSLLKKMQTSSQGEKRVRRPGN